MNSEVFGGQFSTDIASRWGEAGPRDCVFFLARTRMF